MVIGRRGEDWTPSEVETVLEAYFAMLEWQLTRKEFKKVEVIVDLQGRLPTRTRGSIERKLSNVSAVLEENGYVWLKGYTPLANYQRSLVGRVNDWLSDHPDVRNRLGP
jgi:5-methylcytosine-specific restriction protein A